MFRIFQRNTFAYTNLYWTLLCFYTYVAFGPHTTYASGHFSGALKVYLFGRYSAILLAPPVQCASACA
jgi:hypothetical protein